MDRVNVLVLGVGGNVSQGIIKAINYSNIECNIIGACISSESIGLYFCNKAYISPYANSNEFIPWLIDVCNKESIDIILTGVEENIIAMAFNKDIIKNNTKAKFISSTYEKLMIGQDKLLTSKWLEENDCNYPQYCESKNKDKAMQIANELGFPLIAKPRKGKGSFGLKKIENLDDLLKVTKLDDYLIQEYIGDDMSEYTVGCYCDKYGILQKSIIMHRILHNGTTYRANVVNNDIIKHEVENICSKFKPIGPLNIQLRLDRLGRPVCFELNVRFSGTTPMRAHFGYNDVEAMIKEYVLNQDITNNFNIINGTACRFTDEVYIFDDALVRMKTDCYIDDLSKYNISVDTLGRR